MQLNINTSARMELAPLISPRMIQSMEILQLPVMALQERIEHEMQENPFLELREPGSEEDGYPKDAELGETVETPAPAEPAPVEYLISHIDDRGYLGYFDETKNCHHNYTLEELLNEIGGGITLEQMSDALEYVQQLDPPGVGARDTRECLLLQLTPDTVH